MQSDFQNLWKVEVTGQNISFVSECTGLNTSAGTAAASIFNRLACIEQFLDDCIGVVECRLAPAFSGDLACTFEEALWGLFADLYVGAWLEQFHLIHAVQNQVADIVDTIMTVWCDTAGIDVCKVGVGAAFF